MLFPYSPDASRFTVVCRREDYSAGRIAQAIEDCNAHVLNLNVTSLPAGEGKVAVDIRVDRKNTASIARSLARYDYIVAGEYGAEETVDEGDRERVAELLRYIDI